MESDVMAITKLDYCTPCDETIVKITEMGWITEVMYQSSKNEEARIRKIDRDHYEDLRTGEIKEFNHWEHRASSANSLRKTFRRLRNTVNANIINLDHIRFITLTYRQDDGEPMTNPQKLYKDFEVFNKRLKRYSEREGHGSYEYINIVEPQGSGAWHSHLLLFYEEKAPYLKNEIIREMWGQGWVTVRSLKNQFGKSVDNIGAYLTAYLGDLPVEDGLRLQMDISRFEAKSVEVEESGKKETKYYLKGARLFLYPTGMRIIRTSKGIKRPIESEGTYEEAKRKMSGSTLTFQTHLQIQTDNMMKIVSKRYYNSKTKGSQKIIGNNRVDLETGEVLE